MLIREEDCGTKEGLVIKKQIRPTAFVARIFGRYAAEDIKDQKGKVVVSKGDIIDDETAKKIDELGIVEVVIRSPLTCATRFGVCAKCYGWDLSTKQIVEIGEPVGVISAQSIGEPGTQLTLRTKHSGGVIGVDVTQGLPRVEELFEARTPKIISPLSEIPGKVSVSEGEDGWVVKVESVNVKPKRSGAATTH